MALTFKKALLGVTSSAFLFPAQAATYAPKDPSSPSKVDEHLTIKGKALTQLGNLSSILGEQGVGFSAAGGVSALPVLNGLMGDRIKVLVDGAEITASCANQMNPPLSYVSASQVSTSSVVAGISAVRVAGDNIAGVISVDQIKREFSDSATLSWQRGYLSGEYQSNGNKGLTGAGAQWSSQHWMLNYQGAYQESESYDDGNGNKVIDTLYQSQNHALVGAWKEDVNEAAVKLSYQSIPYQGFPNQYMDMTDNESLGLNAQFERVLTHGGRFKAHLSWQDVEHEMGFFTAEKMGMMPMVTDAYDASYKLLWRFPLSSGSQLYLGHEAFAYRLDDYWPAVDGSMMMGPNTYRNINGGERDRLALFVDSDIQLSARTRITAGTRVEQVTTDTGPVQPYNTGSVMGMPNVDAAAAERFNAADRAQSDTLVDATFTLSRDLDARQKLELGVARKNRAPNLYERYSWGQGIMATTMIGWFGDGNGYIGDVKLKPETAHTFGLTYTLRQDHWALEVSPFYTRVDDYIDAEVVKSFNSADLSQSQRNILQFSNLDATLYGVNLGVQRQWSDAPFGGDWQVKVWVEYTHGERDDTAQPLYQIEPLNTTTSLKHSAGRWTQKLSWSWMSEKDRVDPRRLENVTESYHLLSWEGALNWDSFTFSVAITNLLDEFYRQPLGGVSVAEYRADAEAGFSNIAGAGRSVNLGVVYRF